MSENAVWGNTENEGQYRTLINNASAAAAICRAIEPTIGPKGNDVMLVSSNEEVVVTNDGFTILNLMEIKHPVAQMIVSTAKSQFAEIGDGTTTTTLIAGTLITEGVSQIVKGVPVSKVINGIKQGVSYAIELIKQRATILNTFDDSLLYSIARIAGRGDEEIAGLIVQGARRVGYQELLDGNFKFSELVSLTCSSSNKLIEGIMINKEPLNAEMPTCINNARILIVDDAVGPEYIEREAIKTEPGFNYYLESLEKYKTKLQKICDLGINVLIVDRGIDEIAEELCIRSNILVVQRVSTAQIDRVCKHTGATKIKRATLNLDITELADFVGEAEKVYFDKKTKQICILKGKGQPAVTILIGAATEEVGAEKERIAQNAAAAVQAAILGGIIPGGGAFEVWLANALEEKSREADGMTSLGISCVKEALQKIFAAITINAGFNPLEKIGEVIAAQRCAGKVSISINCENGDICDAWEEGILDPASVKIHALQSAAEVAVAVLKINAIIKMKDNIKRS